MKSVDPARGLLPGDPAYRSANTALFLTGLVTFSLLYSPQPILPLLARQFHLGAAAVSLAVSAGTAGLVIGLPLWSAWSDRHGRRPVIVVALLCASLLTPLLGAVHSFWWLASLRLLQGVAVAGVPATAMAYLGEEVAPTALGAAMGLYISGNSIGGMSGRLAVGLVAGAYGWRAALFALGALAISLSLLAVRLLPASRRFRPTQRRAAEHLRALCSLYAHTALRPLLAVGALLMAAFVAVYNYLGFLLVSSPYDLPVATASAVYLFYLVGSLSSFVLGRLADRVGQARVLEASVLLTLLGLGVTLFTPLWLKLLGLGLFTFGFFGGHSAASTLVSLRAGEERGAASSLYLLSYYLGSSVGGTVIGLLWQALLWPGVVLGGAGALLPAALLALLVRHRNDSRPTADDPAG